VTKRIKKSKLTDRQREEIAEIFGSIPGNDFVLRSAVKRVLGELGITSLALKPKP